METLSKKPQPPEDFSGQIINGRLIGDFHRIDRYWKWDWSCVLHGTKSAQPMRIKDIKNRKGPRCCYDRKGIANPRWAGYGSIPMTYFNQVKNGAAVRGIAFNITIEDMDRQWKIQNGVCRYTGHPMRVGNGPTINNITGDLPSASLDRISSDIGYQKNNIQWVRKDVNMAKQSLSDQEFLKMCKDVFEYAWNSGSIFTVNEHAKVRHGKYNS